MTRSDPWWPLRGLVWLLSRPRLWLRPVLAQAGLLSVMVAAMTTVGWYLWPVEAVTGWARAWEILLALGAGLTAGTLAWLVAAPLITALVLDALAAEVRRHLGQGVDAGGWHSVPAALSMLRTTFLARLGWTAVTLVALFLGPIGPLVGAYAMARVASLDAFDTALAAGDGHAACRRQGLIDHAGDRTTGALVAALLSLALGMTIIGWVLWMPALVCGAALRLITARESGPHAGTLPPPGASGPASAGG